jgi:uncharacterized protein
MPSTVHALARIRTLVRGRDIALVALLYVLLVALGTWEGYAFTTTLPEAVSMPRQRLHNLLDGLLLHGRGAAKLVRERVYHVGDMGFPLVMHAVGWGVHACVLVFFLACRRGLVAWWTRRVLGAEAAPQREQVEAGTAAVAVAQSTQTLAPLPRVVSRRRMLLDAGAGLTTLAGAGLAYDAFVYEPFAVRVARYTLAIRGLPKQLEGVRLVQLTDTHVGRRVPAVYVRQVAERAMGLRPDVVLLTGDYVHSGEGHVQASIASFAPVFDAKVPVVAVLGNHDFYGADKALRREFARSGVPLLENGRLFLDAATRTLLEVPAGPALCIAGLSDYTEDRIIPAKALAGVDESMPRIVLCHNPDAAEDATLLAMGLRIDLMVSGHTHGGQVRLPLLGTPIVPSKFGSKYAAGLVAGPAFPVLVCRGIGMSIIPVRWNVPPEILELTLVGA